MFGRICTYLFTGIFCLTFVVSGTACLVGFFLLLLGHTVAPFFVEIELMDRWQFLLSLVATLCFGVSLLGLGGAFIVCNFLETSMLRSNKISSQQRRCLTNLHPCIFTQLNTYTSAVTSIYADLNSEKDNSVRLGIMLSKTSNFSMYVLIASFTLLMLAVSVYEYLLK